MSNTISRIEKMNAEMTARAAMPGPDGYKGYHVYYSTPRYSFRKRTFRTEERAVAFASGMVEEAEEFVFGMFCNGVEFMEAIGEESGHRCERIA